MLIQVNNITKNFSTKPIFKGLTLAIHSGDKIGLVGMNGCGKSTLLQILTGEEGISEGTVSRQKGLTIGYVPQKLSTSDKKVKEYLLDSFEEIAKLGQKLHQIEKAMTDPEADIAELLTKYGRLQESYEEAGGYTLEDRISGTLKGLGVADKLEVPLSALSGGQRVRVELARVLTEPAEVLLLDEPTNHLDIAGIDWLESYLRHSKQAYLVISHDREFLDQVVDRIVEIEGEQAVNYPGNYSKFSQLKQERLVLLQKNYDLQQKEIQRLQRMSARYRQWGREADNEDFFRKAKEIERRIQKLKQALLEPPKSGKKRLQQVAQANRSGKEVLIAEGIGKIAGERILFTESDFTIYRQERLALMGANGSGKTTLIRCLLGEELLDEGMIKLGASVKIGYLPQKLDFADRTLRILDYVRGFLAEEQKARRILAQFGFFAEDISKRIQDISGGEQMRLYLLRLFQQKINFLILDEPTNHLDIDGKEELEAILADFEETLLVVSHDRYFLRKVTTGQLLIEEEAIRKGPQYN
ncbi:ribosomal protection-like ABC-F family protein [Candidatus Enterococcus murrayae]|uniref:ABC-F family ATP-binding cassette domain-containing protein n=1 Tax=Candidatus Enterococcus murrayae TaxID=2815321 RepID=A0ABS3HKG1_9ENTE|nr:ABC-F family ATP-binding cassette domain-containing protein [Enterococcus sp. MJM16]MBO0453937.1 ABC-F family ATP-binding cassette domain-containing protein [Enterococcus sp. MJM16]